MTQAMTPSFKGHVGTELRGCVERERERKEGSHRPDTLRMMRGLLPWD